MRTYGFGIAFLGSRVLQWLNVWQIFHIFVKLVMEMPRLATTQSMVMNIPWGTI
jgi:hypothetical protein